MQLTEPNPRSPGIVIINGGTQGLGEAIARKITADGAKGMEVDQNSAPTQYPKAGYQY